MYGFHSVEQEIGTRQRISQALINFKTLLDVAVYFKHHHNYITATVRNVSASSNGFKFTFSWQILRPATLTVISLNTLLILLKQAHKIKCFQVKEKNTSHSIFTVQHVKSPQWFQTVIKKNQESEEKSTLQQLSHWVLQAYMLTYLLQFRVTRAEYLIINLICQQCVCFHVFNWFRDWKHFPVETYNTE